MLIQFIIYIFGEITRILTSQMNLVFPRGTISNNFDIKVIHIVIFGVVLKLLLDIVIKGKYLNKDRRQRL